MHALPTPLLLLLAISPFALSRLVKSFRILRAFYKTWIRDTRGRLVWWEMRSPPVLRPAVKVVSLVFPESAPALLLAFSSYRFWITLFMVRGHLFFILGIIATLLFSHALWYLIPRASRDPQKLVYLRRRSFCAQCLEHGVSAIVFSSVAGHYLTSPKVALAFIISK